MRGGGARPNPPAAVDRSGVTVWRRRRLRDRLTMRTAALLFVLTSLVATFVFRAIAGHGYEVSDLPAHVVLLLESRKTGATLGYSIYYPLLSWLSLGSDDPDVVLGVATALLGVLVGLRVVLTYFLVSVAGSIPNAVRVAIAIALTVVMPFSVPGDQLYLGKFSPVIWHNSTTILAAPVSLALFAACCEYLGRRVLKANWLHFAPPVLLVAAAVTKPNYVLALMPAIGVYALWWVLSAPISQRHATFRHVAGRVAVLLGATAVVLAALALSTFGGSGLMIGGEHVSFGIRPMVVWHLLTNSAIWATIASFALPALMTLAMPRAVRRSSPVVLAWITTLVAVVQFMLLAEVLQPSGSILPHGNWMWGAHLSTFVLYVVVTSAFVGRWSSMRPLRWVAVVLGAIQVALGLYYVIALCLGAPATDVRLFG